MRDDVGRPFDSGLLRSVLDACADPVEIVDAEGRPFPGFEASACVPLADDALDHAFRWRGDPSPTPSGGGPVTVVLKLTDAEVFSLWWE